MRDQTFPPVVFLLLLSNCLIYAVSHLLPAIGGPVYANFALYSNEPYFAVWQPLTYAFLHQDTAHLALNMFALWMFGRSIEDQWGSSRFGAYYLVCVLGAAAAQLGLAAISGQPSATVGASGGVFGVLLAYGMTFPNRRVMLLFPPIPMPAKYLVIGYGVIELYFGLTQPNATIAHFAHLGGMVSGLLLILFWRARRDIR